MRIAGINSSNYQLNFSQTPPNHNSSGPPVQVESTAVTQNQPEARTATPRKAEAAKEKNPEFVTHQNGALMQASAKHVVRSNGTAVERVRFYSRGEVSANQVWQAYRNDSQATATAVPDNTSHKARLAISEYLQTQYLEERQHFEQALGVDEYA